MSSRPSGPVGASSCPVSRSETSQLCSSASEPIDRLGQHAAHRVPYVLDDAVGLRDPRRRPGWAVLDRRSSAEGLPGCESAGRVEREAGGHSAEFFPCEYVPDNPTTPGEAPRAAPQRPRAGDRHRLGLRGLCCDRLRPAPPRSRRVGGPDLGTDRFSAHNLRSVASFVAGHQGRLPRTGRPGRRCSRGRLLPQHQPVLRARAETRRVGGVPSQPDTNHRVSPVAGS